MKRRDFLKLVGASVVAPTVLEPKEEPVRAYWDGKLLSFEEMPVLPKDDSWHAFSVWMNSPHGVDWLDWKIWVKPITV